jgi:hypothetical protein
MSQVACSRCGAVMVPEADGRTYNCPFCKAHQQVAIGADQIAAGLAADLANVDVFLYRLAQTLHQGFAEQSRITAQGNFVQQIEVHFETAHFVVLREGQQAVAQQKKVVRGVALKTKQLRLDEWFAKLTEALAEHANSNARAAWVLGQLGGPTRR